jgi:hypothetical protein
MTVMPRYRNGAWYDDKGRPLSARRARRMERKMRRRLGVEWPPQPPSGGDATGDREPRVPRGPLPSLAAHADPPQQ